MSDAMKADRANCMREADDAWDKTKTEKSGTIMPSQQATLTKMDL